VTAIFGIHDSATKAWILMVMTSTKLIQIAFLLLNIFHKYTGCHRRNGPNFGRVFLMLKYSDITQNTYIQS